jgi:uncharacterized RDD family membrane protein YckC
MKTNTPFSDLAYAPFRSRFLASLMDMSLLDFFSFILIGAGYFTHSRLKLEIPFNFMLVYIFSRSILSFFYHVWGVQFRCLDYPSYGITFGKKIFRMVIIQDESQTPLTLKASFWRFISYGIDVFFVLISFFINVFSQGSVESSLPFLSFSISGLVLLFVVLFPAVQKEHKALHDLLMRTSCRVTLDKNQKS